MFPFAYIYTKRVTYQKYTVKWFNRKWGHYIYIKKGLKTIILCKLRRKKRIASDFKSHYKLFPPPLTII